MQPLWEKGDSDNEPESPSDLLAIPRWIVVRYNFDIGLRRVVELVPGRFHFFVGGELDGSERRRAVLQRGYLVGVLLTLVKPGAKDFSFVAT